MSLSCVGPTPPPELGGHSWRLDPLLSLAAVVVVLGWSLLLRYFQREEEDTTSGAMELGQELSKPGPRRKVRVVCSATSRCVDIDIDMTCSSRAARSTCRRWTACTAPWSAAWRRPRGSSCSSPAGRPACPPRVRPTR